MDAFTNIILDKSLTKEELHLRLAAKFESLVRTLDVTLSFLTG